MFYFNENEGNLLPGVAFVGIHKIIDPCLQHQNQCLNLQRINSFEGQLRWKMYRNDTRILRSATHILDAKGVCVCAYTPCSIPAAPRFVVHLTLALLYTSLSSASHSLSCSLGVTGSRVSNANAGMRAHHNRQDGDGGAELGTRFAPRRPMFVSHKMCSNDKANDCCSVLSFGVCV